MKRKIVIIVLVLLVIITGIMLIFDKKNNKHVIDKNEQEIVTQNGVVYININPLLKIEYQEKFKLCEDLSSSAICSDITTKVLNVELLNEDAKNIYNKADFRSDDIYDAINEIIKIAMDNNYDTSLVEITYNSGNFLQDKITSSDTTNITFKFEPNIDEEAIINALSEDYSIIFDTDGGSDIVGQTVSKNGLVIKPDDPTKSGYTFVEWQVDGKPYHFSSPVTSNLILKAIWSESAVDSNHKSYTVTFNSDDGSLISTQTINEGSLVIAPSIPKRKGYTFAGWTLNGETYDFSTPVMSDLVLVATWNEN